MSKSKLQHVQRKIREILRIHMVWGLVLWQVLLSAGPSLFLSGQKMKILQWRQWAPIALSCYLSEICQWILGVYVAQVSLTNTHFGFGGLSPIFYHGQKNNFWQHCRQGSEFHNWKEYGKSKT